MESVRVNVFPGIPSIPLLVATERGFFAREGLRVEVQRTPSSQAQRAALLRGQADLAHAAFDDVVAGVEDAGADFVAFLGGDSGFQGLYARPPAARISELRGRIIAVDDPETAYALVLRKMLRTAGVAEGEYVLRAVGGTAQRFEAIRQEASLAASMFSPPFSVQAEELGWRCLGGTVDVLGPYQGTVGFCRRAWLSRNRDLAVRYVRGYVAGLRWALDPAHRREVVRGVMTALRVPLPVAERSCAPALGEGGFAPDAAMDLPGMRGVLAIRAEIQGQWGGSPPPFDPYVDSELYREARASSA